MVWGKSKDYKTQTPKIDVQVASVKELTEEADYNRRESRDDSSHEAITIACGAELNQPATNK